MPKVNVYLPDDLAAAVREAGLSVSPICQRALAEAVRTVVEARGASSDLRTSHPRAETVDWIADRLTPRLRNVLLRAHRLAGSRRPVETVQLVAAVLDEPDNLGLEILRSLGVDVAALRTAAGPRRRRSEQGGTGEPLRGLSAGARAALAAAVEAAADLGHTFLGSEHLVLGLSEQPDGAGELLRAHGADPDAIRRAIPAAVAGGTLGYRHGRAELAERFDALDRRLERIEGRLRAGGL
jgi:ATP-dependent Clp protease ATP-binding subunit ClpC